MDFAGNYIIEYVYGGGRLRNTNLFCKDKRKQHKTCLMQYVCTFIHLYRVLGTWFPDISTGI